MAISKQELNKKKEADAQGLLPAVAQRWSPRAFDPAPVSVEDLKTVLEAGRWAASSSNEQPWRFLVGMRGSVTHAKLLASLVPANRDWASHAGVLMLGFAKTHTERSGRENAYALYDLGQSVAQMSVQATALGLKTHQMGGYDRASARAAFELGDEYALGAMIALGHQADPVDLPDEQAQERETAPRSRKPLELIALTELDTPFLFEE